MTMVYRETQKKEENLFFSSLTLEVDDLFYNLRKADKIIHRELNLLSQQKFDLLEKTSLTPLTPLNEQRLKEIIDKMPRQYLLADEYIIYMLENEENSLFKLIRGYNEYLAKRKNQEEDDNPIGLLGIDEKLAYYIRHLGAMIYHLNIHLNLLSVLLKNTSLVAEIQQAAFKENHEIVSEELVNHWGQWQQNVRFLEITIDEPYAIVTWTLEDLKGDAILVQDEGYWQLINISTGVFGLKDFEKADVSLEVAEQMLKRHHEKLGY